jgi:hypothetical protein
MGGDVRLDAAVITQQADGQNLGDLAVAMVGGGVEAGHVSLRGFRPRKADEPRGTYAVGAKVARLDGFGVTT